MIPADRQRAPQSETAATARHDWAEAEILALFELPFNELLFCAQSTHRRHFDPNRVQFSRLLSIKTGGCPEDCKYCPHSLTYATGIGPEKLMDVEAVMPEEIVRAWWWERGGELVSI